MPVNHHREPLRLLGIALVCLAAVGFLAPATSSGSAPKASIYGTDSAETLAQAIAVLPEASQSDFRVARSVEVTDYGFGPGTPPTYNFNHPQNAISDLELGGFPTDGWEFGILTNGNARYADDSNDEGDLGYNAGGAPPPDRGSQAFDVTTLRIDVDVPPGANCLSFDYRFLSEEFPEYVGKQFNDAFVAELDESDWSVAEGGEIDAPHDFATGTGQVVSVNGVGPGDVFAERANGTTYDAATELVSTEAAITPGAHSVYFSIFDASDHAYDSAVFLDALDVSTAAPGSCFAPGTPPDIDEPDDPGTPTNQTQTQAAGAPAPPSPDQGESVVVSKVDGKVLIKRPGAKEFSLLLATEEIPVGSIVDATKGVVTLTTALPGGGTQSAKFSDGIFLVKQKDAGNGIVEIALRGGDFSGCGASNSANAARKEKPKRRLWGDGHGKYRTRGRHSSGTVRGTRWLTSDTCKGTLTKVRRGRVAVRDFSKRKTVLVKAGQSYLATGAGG